MFKFFSSKKSKIEQTHENNLKNMELDYKKKVEIEQKNHEEKLRKQEKKKNKKANKINKKKKILMKHS